MMLETHMKLGMAELNFPEKNFFLNILKEFFEYIIKFCHYVLLNLFYNENIYAVFLLKSHIWENSGS